MVGVGRGTVGVEWGGWSKVMIGICVLGWDGITGQGTGVVFVLCGVVLYHVFLGIRGGMRVVVGFELRLFCS